MKMNWAQLLSRRFFFIVCFPSILIAKKGPCYHFIDDVRFRVCVEAGLKDSLFFFFA